MAVKILRDIPFTRARIGWNEGRGPMQEMELKLDAYLSEAPANQPRPALVMAFGGAFHVGSKENDVGSDERGTSTATADYCRRFAEAGMAAFSVQYRLARDDPAPGERVLLDPDGIPMERIIVGRQRLGLPPIAARAMSQIMEAAFDDVTTATRFIKAKAADFGIDPARLVLGGFSAGGRSMLYSAYAKRVDAAGVISISGTLRPLEAETYLTRAAAIRLPPLLMISGEHDHDNIREARPHVKRAFREACRDIEWVEVPDHGHFYPADARVEDGRSVYETMRQALQRWVG